MGDDMNGFNAGTLVYDNAVVKASWLRRLLFQLGIVRSLPVVYRFRYDADGFAIREGSETSLSERRP